MRVLILSHNLEGGAGGAAYRLHQGLRGIDVPVQSLIYRYKAGANSHPDRSVILARRNPILSRLTQKDWRARLDRQPLSLFKYKGNGSFFLQWVPDRIPAQVAQLAPDVINLHAIIGGFLQIESLAKLKAPIVWTQHEMWAFTGGCDYSEDCDRYTHSCGNCPLFDRSSPNDVSRWVWQRKEKAWRNLNLTLVTPSQWLADCSRSSSLFRDTPVHVIPNGIDTEAFRPIGRAIARRSFNLPQDKKLVLFGAWHNSPRKGFHLLEAALQHLSRSKWRDRIELVVFGGWGQPNLGFPCHVLGKLNDTESLARAYSAADVFVAPSTADNLPTTVLEATACGTPTVAFDIGGMPDMIDHQYNGYLADPFDTEDLARGMVWVLEQDADRLSRRSRTFAERNFTIQRQAERYSSLFQEVVGVRSTLPL